MISEISRKATCIIQNISSLYSVEAIFPVFGCEDLTDASGNISHSFRNVAAMAFTLESFSLHD
eukprot:m.283177 g.283177  ORF g.283177 m.283177 type:complete len:63 (+) comp40669_c0_seq21:1772-1960(+)